MEKQYGVYCTQREWLGVMAAASRGMIGLIRDGIGGDNEAKQMAVWADPACLAFKKRVMEELGMPDVYEACAGPLSPASQAQA